VTHYTAYTPKPFPRYNIKRWLEQEGAEVIAPPIAVWLAYWMRFPVQEGEDPRAIEPSAPLKITAIKALQWLFRITYTTASAKSWRMCHMPCRISTHCESWRRRSSTIGSATGKAIC
jgi:predicted nucleotide-binding protein (sugar kinase/HSP70/actin superfamily)